VRPNFKIYRCDASPFVSISQVFDSLVGLFGLVLFHLLCLFVSLIALYSVSPYHSAHTRKYLNFYGILSNVAVDANLVNSVHQLHNRPVRVFVTGPDSNGFAFSTPLSIQPSREPPSERLSATYVLGQDWLQLGRVNAACESICFCCFEYR